MDNSKAKSLFRKWFSRGRPLAVAAVALLTLAWAPPPARGDEAAPLKDGWDVTIGGGGGYTPEYEGGRHRHFEPLPYFDITWYDANGRARTFLNVDDGLGIDLVSTTAFKLGPLLTWRPGRQESDSSELRGLGNAHDSFQAGGILEYDPGECCSAFLKVRRDLNSDRGLFVDLGGEAIAPIAPRHWFVDVRLVTTWANARGLQPLFGITQAQSANSGLSAYAPSSGFRDVTAQPTLIYDFDGHWALAARLTYERLLDKAADSPLIRTRGDADQFSYELQLSYHF